MMRHNQIKTWNDLEKLLICVWVLAVEAVVAKDSPSSVTYVVPGIFVVLLLSFHLKKPIIILS